MIHVRENVINIVQNSIIIITNNHAHKVSYDHHLEEEATIDAQGHDDHFNNDNDDTNDDDEPHQFQEIITHHRIPPESVRNLSDFQTQTSLSLKTLFPFCLRLTYFDEHNNKFNRRKR